MLNEACTSGQKSFFIQDTISMKNRVAFTIIQVRLNLSKHFKQCIFLSWVFPKGAGRNTDTIHPARCILS